MGHLGRGYWMFMTTFISPPPSPTIIQTFPPPSSPLPHSRVLTMHRNFDDAAGGFLVVKTFGIYWEMPQISDLTDKGSFHHLSTKNLDILPPAYCLYTIFFPYKAHAEHAFMRVNL